MGNQARVAEGASVVSTSTRNFPNRLGKGANVYLASAELAAVAAIIGKIPTVAEYLQYAKTLDATAVTPIATSTSTDRLLHQEGRCGDPAASGIRVGAAMALPC